MPKPHIPIKKKIDNLVFLNEDQREKKEQNSKECKAVIQNLRNGLYVLLQMAYRC